MKRGLTFLILLAMLTVALTPVMAQECMDELGCVIVSPDDPIVVGYMLTTSGATSFLGEDSLGGIELAVLSYDGELMGHELEITGEDSLCTTEGGQTAAQRVTADSSIVGVIGTNCSSAAAGALPIISDAGYVMISSSNTSPRLTDDDPEADGLWQPGYYRTAHNDLFQGAIAAAFAYSELGATTIATIHDGSPYADSLQEVAAAAFTEFGGEVVFQGAVNVGDTDMTAILTEVAASNPDILYFPVFEPESNFIASQARTIPGLEDVILMSADGSLVASFPENTGDAAIGMYLTGPVVAGDTYDEFLALWDDEIGGVPPSGFHAHAYDATIMLLQAVEAVAEVGDDGTLVIGRQALRDALTATTDYAGLTGTLTCDEFGDCATGEALGIYEITSAEVDDGNWPPVIIWTPADMMED